MEYLVGFLIGAFIGTVILWLGAKIMGVRCGFLLVFLIAGISAIVGLIPYVGGLLGLAAMLFLFVRLTEANLWPEAIGIVLISWALSFAAAMLLAGVIV